MTRVTTLVLGIEEGKSFYAQDTKIVISKIKSPTVYEVEVQGPITKQFVVTDRSLVTVSTNPLVQLGVGKNQTKSTARVLISAPENVKLLREELYEEGSNGG
ncbi:MAG: hypothetical protein GQ570_03775 [Helicobacteraceae bacterium]|nr:hypothetical protein [Helicobacteraceae bacterium]